MGNNKIVVSLSLDMHGDDNVLWKLSEMFAKGKLDFSEVDEVLSLSNRPYIITQVEQVGESEHHKEFKADIIC